MKKTSAQAAWARARLQKQATAVAFDTFTAKARLSIALIERFGLAQFCHDKQDRYLAFRFGGQAQAFGLVLAEGEDRYIFLAARVGVAEEFRRGPLSRAQLAEALQSAAAWLG